MLLRLEWTRDSVFGSPLSTSLERDWHLRRSGMPLHQGKPGNSEIASLTERRMQYRGTQPPMVSPRQGQQGCFCTRLQVSPFPSGD